MKELPRGLELRGKHIRMAFMYNGQLCRETLKLDPTPANIKFAERKRNAVLHEIEIGTFKYHEHFPNSQRAKRNKPGAHISIADALHSWHEACKRETRYSTWEDYGRTIDNVLIPQFGELRWPELTWDVIRDWRNSLKCGPKRANNLMIPLRAICDEAFYAGTIERNPMERIKNLEVTNREADPFEPEEVKDIIEAAPKGPARNFISFAFATGLRTGELLALSWEACDHRRQTVHIDCAVVRGREEQGTKTRSGTRDIALLAPALYALQDQRAYTQLIGGRVFHNPRSNHPWRSPAELHKALWKPTLAAAGVRYRNQYQTRHTFASTVLMGGFPELKGMEPMALVMWLTRQMGHTNPQMIFKVYGKYLKSYAPQMLVRHIGEPMNAAELG